jgi:predicted nuclease with TOPRIM domain
MFVGSSPQANDEPTSLKQENERLKSNLEAASKELRDVKGELHHLNEVANRERHGREEVTNALY